MGGPDAPAETMADVAEGDGGGRTTPEECESELVLPPRSLELVALVPEWGLELESAVALPSLETSSAGIWTLRIGRPPPNFIELVRDGGAKSGTEDAMDDIEAFRFLSWVWARGGGGEGLTLPRATATASTDCERLLGLAVTVSAREGSALDVDEAQC